MQKFEAVMSSEKPEEKVFSETIVDVNTNVKQVGVHDEMSGTITQMWQYDVERYSVSEYAEVMSEQLEQTNQQFVNRDEQLLTVQLAVVDLFEIALGMGGASEGGEEQ